MKVYEALADALVAEGIEVVFGLLGGGNAGLIWDLQQRGVRFVPTRHEQGAVGMADGYSRATRKIGLASVSHGPGLSNAATPMISARHSKSALLVITSDTTPDNRHNNMNFDQPPFILSTAGALQQLAKPALLTEAVELSLRHIRLGQGPIVLNTPDDVINAEMPAGLKYLPTGLANVPHQPVKPGDAIVAQVIERIRACRRPVILAGRGAVKTDSRDVLVSLAGRIGALVTTTLLAKGFFARYPFDLGICGGLASPGAFRILQEADLVLAFGTSLSKETTSYGSQFGSAKIIQFDVDSLSAMDQTIADQIVVGDCRSAAEALLAALSKTAPMPIGHRWQSADVAGSIAGIDPWEGVDFTELPGFVNPYRAYKLADEMLPRERLLLVDGGYFMGGPAAHISVLHPNDLVLPWRFGAIGGATGPAIGAAIGRPDRTTVLFTGDGGFMMNLQEIDTAVRCNVPMVIFVIDNGGFAMERPYYRRKGWDPVMADYENPDFGKVASALGFDGYTPASSDDLATILSKVGKPKRPTLINLRVKRNSTYHEMDRYAGGNRRPGADPARMPESATRSTSDRVGP